MHRNKLIERKPAKLIDVLKGFVMIALKDQIIYFNVNKYVYPENN